MEDKSRAETEGTKEHAWESSPGPLSSHWVALVSLFQLIPMTFGGTMSKYLQKESNPQACFTYEPAYYVETSWNSHQLVAFFKILTHGHA